MSLVQNVTATIQSLLASCNITYNAFPLDQGLYQECLDEAIKRGYPTDGPFSVRTYLNEGVFYAALAYAHLPDRRAQIWAALYTSCAIFIDDVTSSPRFPSELPTIYQFNNRFLGKQAQMTTMLDAFADILHQIPELFQPIPTHLMTAANLTFVAACLLEHEIESMVISSAAHEFPIYQRTMTGVAEAYAFVVFPQEIPLNDYIQAIPEMILFMNNVNDVLSFYKEELAGESTNRVSEIAARSGKSKLEALQEISDTTADIYERTVKILERSPEACEAFKQYAAGYVYYHTSSKRYKLADLEL